MSQVIQFLAASGNNAQLCAADYADSVALLQIDGDQKRALLDRDPLALAELLNGRTRMFCFVNLPDKDEPEPLQDDEDGDLPEEQV